MFVTPVLTLTRYSLPIYTRTHNHDIVYDSKAALATHPPAVSVPHPTICQDGRLVHLHALLMVLAREGQLLGREVLPGGAVDDFIWSIAEDVDDGVGGIEDAGVWGEV